MKTTTLLLRRALLFCVFLCGFSSYIFAQVFTDNASNSAYSGGWNNASNGGSGFGAWSLSSDGVNAGRFIGNPAAASYGMSNAGIGSTAFGLFGHSGQYSYALRSFNTSLGIGDILTFHWSMNWDCGNSGSKGWELRSGSTIIFGVGNSNSPTITYNGVATGTVSTNYGTSAMLVTLQRISATQYTVSITKRNTPEGTFSTTITSSAAIDNIRIYIGGQQTNEGQRNIFFNNFQIQKPDQYRSSASGNWSSASTWEISSDGGTTWAAATAPPGSTLGSTITIRNGHTVSQNQNYSAGSNNTIVVESGATLNMTGATGDFQFNTMSVSGSVVRNHATNNYVGAITVNNGGKYVHALNGETIQSVTWNSGSTLEVTGVTDQIPTATGTYQNVLWNCTNQNSVNIWSALETNFNNVNGNFTVQNTGAGSLIIGNTATNRTMTVGGDLIISGGAFAIKGAGASAGDIKLVVNGNYNQSSGIFRPSRRDAISTGTAVLELKGNFMLSGGTFENSSVAGLGSVLFAKTGTQVYTKTGGTIASAINFTVNSGSTLSMGTNVLDGSTGTFTLSSGGGLETGHVSGITLTGATGSIQVSGARSYSAAANYTFNGSSAQETGLGFTGANNLTINNNAGVTLSFSGSTSLAGTLSLTAGVFTVGSGNTITVASGGAVLRTAGSLASGSGAGTFTFSGTGTVTGTVGFNDVNIAGGVSFGTASTINGTLTINAGGFVNTSAPIYASGSILKYNTASVYGRGSEWSAISGAGYPNHVLISNGTTLNLGANLGTATARQIAGNLTVESGSVLSMNISLMSAALTVKGNYLNSGITNLSSVSGGDLILEGDLTDNGTFAANGRAVFFHGPNNQSVTSSDDPLDIDVVRFNKTGGEVILLQNLLIDETADPVQFAGTSILNLNGKTATFGKPSTASQITMNSTSAIKGSASSSLTVLGTGSFGSIRFDQTTSGTTNVLGTLTINRTSSGSVALANALQIATALVLTDGTLSLGANTLTINGSVSRTSGTINASAGTLAFGNVSNLSLPTALFTGNILNFNKTSGAGTLTVNDNIVVTNNMSTAVSTGALIIAPSKQLTVQVELNNNGTFTLQNDATFVQATTGNGISGNGTFNVEKALAGNSITWNATSGRFWYMGVPMNDIARSCFGNYAAGSNRVWSYNEISKQYTDIDNNATTLVAGTGYVHRRATNETLTFSASGANGLFSSDLTLNNLSRTPTSQVGFHLISNPYMAYLDWNAVVANTNTATTNIEPTFYLRSFNNPGNDISALISYNASNGQYANASSVAINSANDIRYLAPMQAIWVRVGSAASTGNLSMTRSMLSHQSANPGLKNSTIFPTLARVNLVDGARFDQMLVFMNQDMTNGVDQYDSEKMFVSGAPQLYTMAAGKKLVMNGLKNNKKKISVPLYLELPQSKVYQLQLADFNLEDGLILLEDKLEGTIQDFTINDTYAFYANSGVLSNRFVLHFYMPDATITAQGPSNSWVEDETAINEGGSIVVSSNGRGKVTIQQDIAASSSEKGSVVVRDASGKEVYKGALEGLQTELQIDAPSGVYFVEVQLNGQFEVKKIFVQQ
jgi:hypothetical protein